VFIETSRSAVKRPDIVSRRQPINTGGRRIPADPAAQSSSIHRCRIDRVIAALLSVARK
jgi:hypothetical protein